MFCRDGRKFPNASARTRQQKETAANRSFGKPAGPKKSCPVSKSGAGYTCQSTRPAMPKGARGYARDTSKLSAAALNKLAER